MLYYLYVIEIKSETLDGPKSQIRLMQGRGDRAQLVVSRTSHKSRDCGIDGHATSRIRENPMHPKLFRSPCCDMSYTCALHSYTSYTRNFVNVAVADEKAFRSNSWGWILQRNRIIFSHRRGEVISIIHAQVRIPYT